MPPVEGLREFVKQRLTAAAEEICSEFEQTLQQLQEEIERQRRLLEVVLTPGIKLHRIDFPKQHVSQEEDRPTDQQLRNSSLDQEEPEPPHIQEELEELCTSQEKPEPPQVQEELEELCSSQEVEQFVLKQEFNIVVVTPSEESEHSEAEPNSEQLLSHNSPMSESLCETETGKKSSKGDVQGKSTQSHTKKRRNRKHRGEKLYSCETCGKCFSRIDHLSRHGRTHTREKPFSCETCGRSFNINSLLLVHMRTHTGEKPQSCDTRGPPQIQEELENPCTSQEEPEPSQVQVELEELDELYSGQEEGEQFVLMQEVNIIFVSPSSEESECSETEPDRNNEQRLSHNSPVSESPDQEGSKHVDSGSTRNGEKMPKKRRHRSRSHSNNVDNSPMSESLCDTDAGKKSSNGDVQGKSTQSHRKKPHRKHAGEKPYSCEICGKSFSRNSLLLVHSRTHTGEKPHCGETRGPPHIQEELCRSREEPEPNNDQLLSHNSPAAESPDQEGSRRVDSGSTRNGEKMPKKRRHRSRSHSNNVDNSPTSKSLCDNDTGKKSLKGDVKGKATQSHMKKRHRKTRGAKPHSCEACGKRFSQRRDLTIHMSTHAEQKQFSCKTCGKSFDRNSLLLVHIRTHTGEKPYSCETCGKRFSQNGHCFRHMRTHTGEKPYSCDTCGKKFSLSSPLLRHMKTHTGEKQFSCKTCGKSFSRNAHLLRHMRTHTGEKPYSCKTCGKSFNQSTHLLFHTRTHTGEKPYSCKLCAKSFSRSDLLLLHVRGHKGEKA